jgi:putative transposase
MQVIAHAADISESEGAKLLFAATGGRFTRLKQLWCDGGYGKPGGNFVQWVEKQLHYAVDVVQKAADQLGFAVLPRRWVVERTLAWLCRNRRLSKDYEHHTWCSESRVYIASIGILLRNITEAP